MLLSTSPAWHIYLIGLMPIGADAGMIDDSQQVRGIWGSGLMLITPSQSSQTLVGQPGMNTASSKHWLPGLTQVIPFAHASIFSA